jgi:hypothetical protein
MFHKANTGAERQKIIDNSMMNFDPLDQVKQPKVVFNNFVDSLVYNFYLIEQLYTRRKLNKNKVQSFVN